MGVRLPSEYQEVEYLESTGAAQWIDVGFPITDNLSMELTFAAVIAINAKYYMGLYSSNQGDFYLYSGSGGKFQTAYGCGYLNTSVNFDTNKHTFIFSFDSGNTVVRENDVIIASTPKFTPLQTNRHIRIAGSFTGGQGKVRTYAFVAYSGTTKVADFVPCYRKSDSKPGMYDLVTEQFFVNQATGDDFLVGHDVINSISPLMVAWRRMLMRKPSPIPTGYVTDGLLLWLDAICNTRNGHDANALYWEDLSANHRDYAIGESGLIFGQSVVSFTTVNHKAITTEKAFTSAEQQQIRDNLATIEIGVNFAGSGYQIVLSLGNQHGTINFGNLNGSRTLNFNPKSTSESVSLLGGLHGYNSELWVDGVKQESTDFSTTWTNVRLNLMFSYIVTGQYSFIGDIAYIRIYNRRLTDAELMQNWLRDKARYNL